MKCSNCGGSKLRVIETRRGELSVFRRRECRDCGRLFKTEELHYDGAIPELARQKRRVAERLARRT